MRNSPLRVKCTARTWLVLLRTLVLIGGLSLPAFGSLGGGLDSPHRDSVHVSGSLRVAIGECYTVYEIRISSWAIIREFVSPAGIVFGVAWEGQFVPDLKQFLGSYFQEYSAAARGERSSYIGRRPLRIRKPNLVFESGGHLGSYYGRAYDPQNVPDTVKEEEIY